VHHRYDFDVQFVYFRTHHELYSQWVGLSNTTNKKTDGVQGYLKLSVVVLGPNDKPYVHDPSEIVKQKQQEKTKGVASMLLMPPTIKQEVNFLVATIHRCGVLCGVLCCASCGSKPIHENGILTDVLAHTCVLTARRDCQQWTSRSSM